MILFKVNCQVTYNSGAFVVFVQGAGGADLKIFLNNCSYIVPHRLGFNMAKPRKYTYNALLNSLSSANEFLPPQPTNAPEL